MYNRYIPSADGTYRREAVDSGKISTQSIEQAEAHSEWRSRPFISFPSLDSSDLLVLAVLLLILQNSEEQDKISLIVTLAAFLLLN